MGNEVWGCGAFIIIWQTRKNEKLKTYDLLGKIPNKTNKIIN
jgi:hypothetical protein